MLNQILQTKVVAERAQFIKDWHKHYWSHAKEEDYKDESIRRQLHFHKNLGEAVLAEAELNNV